MRSVTTEAGRLHLYEEIMLLALRNEKGTLSTGFVDYPVAGAVLAELLLDGWIAIADERKQWVEVRNPIPPGDPILDEGLARIVESAKRAPLKTWLTRLAGAKGLRHRVAQQLCRRGILRADEEEVLLLFKRRTYPEIDPVPERRVIDRMRAAIFSEGGAVDPRTVVLISLAQGADLLSKTFGSKEVKSRKARIERIVNGELTGKATREVIEAIEAAIVVAAVLPAVVAGSHH